jgi:hypothetical protein
MVWRPGASMDLRSSRPSASACAQPTSGMLQRPSRQDLATFQFRVSGSARPCVTQPVQALDQVEPQFELVDPGLQPGRPRQERTVVLFGPRPDLVGWATCSTGRPRDDLLPRVNPLTS